jgi:asparagine synthase (glutamine-hydrolysing)
VTPADRVRCIPLVAAHYAKQKVFGFWDDTPAPLRALLTSLLCNPVAERVPLVKKGGSYIHQASVPMPDRMQTYNLLERLGVEQVLTLAFLAQVNRSESIRQQCEVWNAIYADGLLNRQLAFDWRYTLAESDPPKVIENSADGRVGRRLPVAR